MELPVPNSSSMQHPDPDLNFDDTKFSMRIILEGASCTIAAACVGMHAMGAAKQLWYKKPLQDDTRIIDFTF
jgi:hypothetical protein